MADLAALNKTLATASYVSGGYAPTGADFAAFDQVGSADLSKLPNVARWQRHIAAFDAAERAVLSAQAGAPSPVASSSSAAPKADDEDVDLFGSGDEEEDEEAAAAEAKRQQELAAAKKAKEDAAKPKIIEKSVVILDVKPWDSEQDLASLEAKIRSIAIDGLEWKAAELKDIGYGIKKLVISCHIIDSMVSVDDIQDSIQAFEDDVQSTDIAAFSKL